MGLFFLRMEHRKLADVDDDFLTHDHPREESNLTIEFSESISVTSTGSSGSSYQHMKEATSRQQENLFSHGKDVRAAYLKFHCGTFSAKQLCEEISNLGIQETGALRRLLNQNDGNTLQYSKFLTALTHLDEEDLEDIRESFRSPVKATAPSATPFATMEDVLNQQEHKPSKPSNDNDVLTWSVPAPRDETPSRKKEVRTSFKDSPLATFEPKQYVSPVAIPISVNDGEETDAPVERAPFTPQERNELIQAFLGGSLTGKQFLAQLEDRAGLLPSEGLEHLIFEHESGKTIKFLDVVRQLTELKEQNQQNLQQNQQQTYSIWQKVLKKIELQYHTLKNKFIYLGRCTRTQTTAIEKAWSGCLQRHE